MTAKRKLTVGYHVPDDKELLAALGDISIRHGHLDHHLKMMIRIFTEVSAQEAMDATAREGSSSLRDRVKKLARHKLGDGQELVKVQVQALMERCNRVTELRNALVHILCGKDEDGNPVAATVDLATWEPMPTIPDLNALSVDMQALIDDLMNARGKSGFISQALVDKKKTPA